MRERLADCNCPELKSTVSFLPPFIREPLEGLEAELNKMCPVHGLRRFGEIVITDFGDTEMSAKLSQLIHWHRLRLSRYSQPNDEIKENE
jgi:hypothetical protein